MSAQTMMFIKDEISDHEVEALIDVMVHRPPEVGDLGFRHMSQNFKVYATLQYKYFASAKHDSWVSTKVISGIVPGGVTRRINDIRVALQPDRTLRGKVGWWVENKVESIHDPVQGRKIKHSWYRLIYLTEGAET